MAAEGNSGAAAVRCFAELTQSAGKVAQHVRARLSPPGTKSTWLGPSAQLAEALAGSVLRCASAEGEPYWVVVPPRTSSVALVRRSRGGVTVRVSRDGALASAKYEELVSFHQLVLGIVPGILTVGGARGALAPTVKLLATGDEATVSVAAAATAADARPVFVVTCGSDEMIGPTEDFAEVLSELSVHELPWGQFAQGSWWGLPPVVVGPVVRPMPWASVDDAIGIAAVFGLPPVSSNMEVFQFLIGCCESPPAWMDAPELSQASADDAPAVEREALAEVFAKLSEATPSTPEVVDSVHSRLRAILQSEDAPPPFEAFGRAWRQGALEPPARRVSHVASPALTATQRHATRASSPRAQAATLDDELSMLSPNTLRNRLRAFITRSQGGEATRPVPTAAGAASATPVAHSPSPVTRRSPARRVQHSGQLGGLFGGGLAAMDPSLTAPDAVLRPNQPAPPAPPVPAPRAPSPELVPAAPRAPSVASVLPTISLDESSAQATAVIIPAAYHDAPVTMVVQGLVVNGMPDVVAQLAHAAGDTALRATPGSAFEALSLLRHIEEVFADVCGVAPAFASFRERPVARDWQEAVDAVQVLLGKHSSVFRTKRQRGASTAAEHAVTPSAADDKPPVGSFKQVSVATNAERTGACDAQLLEELASAAVLRREHVRASVFGTPNASVEACDAALAGELAHFCSTYGQAATAYLLSNGTSRDALSGYGVPMALAAIRSHLLARATKVIHMTVGFERALLSMSAKCASLATGFLSGVIDLEELVKILGGSAPHEEAEIRREGGSVSSGTLGTTSGDNAQLSIREAFTAWGQCLHLVIGDIPGIATSGVDFAVSSQLKKIPRDLDLPRLLSTCRYMLWHVGVDLSKHRTVRGAPLPDVCTIVHTAMTKVFRERELDQRSEERAVAVLGPLMGPMLTRLQQLEAAQAKGKAYAAASPAAASGKKSGKSAFRSQSDKSGDSTAAQGPEMPSAQEAAQKFLTSLQEKTQGKSGSSPQALVPSSSPSGSGQLTSRLKAIMELSAIYRQHVGMDPKGDPMQEPCSYRALFGKCGQPSCARCQSGKSFPQPMVAAVKSRCVPTLFNENQTKSAKAKGDKGKATAESK